MTAEKMESKDAKMRFKGLLYQHGMSLKDVSDRTGIGLSTLYKRLETDGFKMREIKAISEACSIPVEELTKVLGT